MYRTARVGLSLKKSGEPAARFIERPYRFLTEPKAITKGKAQLVRSLHRTGLTPAAIRALTGVPLKRHRPLHRGGIALAAARAARYHLNTEAWITH